MTLAAEDCIIEYMKPGEGEVIFILDKQKEILALEAGMNSAGIVDNSFSSELFEAGHEADYEDPNFDGKHNSPAWMRKVEPELKITPENVEFVRAAAKATIASRGIVNALMGYRRVAKNILKQL